ncbi:MAG: CRISPR-associated endonuclease Cas1 [Microcoleus sp. PH2017_10_PVI_O_A]|uniref:CRISPR-associated endonuclease Cas1 n=1 Tax=unclassified Microcoleus TaxID=2642155 RepID=UPI001DBCC143|nr:MULTISPECIES: CRISPR-associated endonuclease Cas1 [unclassified Microcoleus]TAF19812.1 MAG: CRISPR-associated endonuclease Cas1 [Oscillatoriales cyanobacterium]MCC3406768.1 CRISPR-associated endonuclease Cas1 [Microcoleus sp. PH2017_10_PVI_O_A]MCC3460904.1 CRISPR-associated endonuclease Cas1 [Microcoleus sp. PH2017_11_PCY_U_A]MCC3479425.1 CRISPR-associated endonuclease Cas1 [Microcoleus sp. PH2017_12_PCY_D_A]MCC3529354.1 CRISPR-associated endonuclease Cas1 [Microcoleus sp. PH2017_21_RUC_O_A
MEFTPEPLHSAWHQVRKGSRSPGIDGITLDLFAGVAQHQLEILLRQLQQESYFPRPAKGFYLPKASGGKRLIGIPTVRDRVVQRFLLGELYWPLEDVFLDCSYAYRPGRGIQVAVKHLYSYYRFGNAWVVKADIEKFFDNLCWPLLLADLEKLQLEPILRQLIEQQLASGIVVKGQSFYPQQGVLQGAILSGALANLYLNEFDRLCLSRGFNLVRFGDDFAIACADSIQANRCLEQISVWLGSLYLKLQPEKTRIFAPDEEFIFLGYLFRDGEVFAPEPPEIPLDKRRVLRPSGTAVSRPTTRKVPVFSGKPLACSISVKRIILPRANSEHFWREPMSTLYVTDQGAYLSVRNQQFQVYSQQELRIKVPVSRVSHIILFGCCNVSHGAVACALHRRIPIFYLSQRGRYFGRLQYDGRAKVEYLTKQVICSMNPEFVRLQAEAIVRAKLHNSRILLMRLNRYRKSKDAGEKSVLQAVEMLEMLMDSLPLAESMDALRGYEGKAATVYFQALGSLFSGPFVFEVRTKRPPTDPINSLMSLGYTLLSQNVSSFVEAVGLHSHFGNLHVPRDNHPALVSDLMEEFRAQVVDSLVTYLVNKKIFVFEDFTPPDEGGGVFLQPHALKKFLKHWDEKLLSETTHPHTGYKVAYRRCLELQVREYVSALMGEVEVYRPMLWDK